MFEIHVDTRIASVKRREKITAGSVGVQCNFAFSGDWDGLGRVAVFETDKHKISVELFTPVVTIPWEVCEEAGLDVIVGVYGTNGTGTIVIPTIYAKLGTVSVGTTTEGAENAQAPTSSDVQQIMSAAAGAVNTANNANSTAAQAVAIAQSVEARANAGEFDGEDGYSPVASVYRDDENESVTVVITDKDGTHAATVFDGKDGMTPQLTIGSVETRSYGYPAEVTITGGIEKPVLNFKLPQGPAGNPGKDYVLTEEDKAEIAWLAGVDKARKHVAYFNGAQIVDVEGYEVPFVELENWFVEDPSLVYIYYNEQAFQLYSASSSQIVFAADYPVGGKMQKHLITVPRRGAVTTTDIDIGDYTKPVDGIPESDLSAAVQTKLNSGGGGAVTDEHIREVAETESIKNALAGKADRSEIPDDEHIKAVAETIAVRKDVAINTTVTGWYLTGLGGCASNSEFSLDKYQVTAGDKLYLKITAPNGCAYQWQSSASVPASNTNPNLIGSPVIGDVDGEVTVPEGATWLIVCNKATDRYNNSVQVVKYVLSHMIDDVKLDSYSLIKDGTATLRTGGGLASTTSGGLAYIKVNAASQAVIVSRDNYNNPIVPAYLDFAVKVALSDCKIDWTEAEQLAAQQRLGIISSEGVGF